MELTDFEYAGEKLSAKGCVVCAFGGSDMETISLGSNLTFTTTRDNNSSEQRKISTTYDIYAPEVIQIMKYDCKTLSYKSFTQDEVSDFMMWLNRKSYKKFRPIYDDNVYTGIYFYGSFNVQAKALDGDIIGLELTFNTNSPYGYKEISPIQKTVGANSSITIKTDSDEEGIIYPTVSVKCTSGGLLKIINSKDSTSTIVQNCVAGETITFDGKTRQITSSATSHVTLAADYNYHAPRLLTKRGDDTNVLTFSLPCTVDIRFSPIRKVGI